MAGDDALQALEGSRIIRLDPCGSWDGNGSLGVEHELLVMGGIHPLRRMYSGNIVEPGGQVAHHFVENLGVRASAAGAHVERMIGVIEKLQGGPFAQTLYQRLQQGQICQLVASALHEKQRNRRVLEVFGALVRWRLRRMERESQES